MEKSKWILESFSDFSTEVEMRKTMLEMYIKWEGV